MAVICRLALMLLLITCISAFYIELTTPTDFCTPEIEKLYDVRDLERDCRSDIQLYVDSLKSVHSLTSRDYDSFDFCQLRDDTSPVENLGQVVFGERIKSSPYKFVFGQDKECVNVCQKTYDMKDPKHKGHLAFLKKTIMLNYQQHWIVDNMPVTWCYEVEGGRTYCSPGFPVGCYVDVQGRRKDACVIDSTYGEKETYYIFNHVNLTIMHHPLPENKEVSRIVAIKVEPISIKHNKPGECLTSQNLNPDYHPMSIKAQTETQIKVNYTFSVKYVADYEVRWASRWNHILDCMPYTNIQWFSLLRVIVLTLIMASLVIWILSTVCREIINNNDDTNVNSKHIAGWITLRREIFCPPSHAALLSVFLGVGVQQFFTVFTTLFLACVGIVSPVNRGSLKMCVMCLLLILGIPAAYVGARMYKAMLGKQWTIIAVLVVVFQLSILLNVYFLLSERVTFWPTLVIGLLMSCVYVPPLLLGVYLGFHMQGSVCKVETKEPVVGSESSSVTRVLEIILAGGLIYIGSIFIHAYVILTSFWYDQYYSSFGFLLVGVILMVMFSSETSIVLCWMHLGKKEHNWWWHSFWIGGSGAIYFFLYCMYFYDKETQFTGIHDGALYVIYTLMMVFLLFVFSGTVAFFACFLLVTKIYGCLKNNVEIYTISNLEAEPLLKKSPPTESIGMKQNM